MCGNEISDSAMYCHVSSERIKAGIDAAIVGSQRRAA
jgi:hypothetical protein